MRTCHICDKPLVLAGGSQIYCDDTCATIGEKAKARVAKADKAYALILNPLKCARCKEPKRLKKKYCEECEEIAAKDSHNWRA